MLMSAAVDEATTDDVATDVAPNAASVATVTHDGVTSEFTSVDEAIAALQGGDTLKLLSTESVKLPRLAALKAGLVPVGASSG